MSEPLRKLIRLQELMAAIAATQETIAAMPAQAARLDDEVRAAETQLAAERARLDELQKDRRRLENDLMGVEQKIQKFQGQLHEVKTNKEYQAVLHEIEAARAGRSSLDEKILMEMEEGDRRSAMFRQQEARLKEHRRAAEEGKKRLEEQRQALERNMAVEEAERDRLSAEIPENYLDPFTRVARQRGGRALVAVREELCDGCHVRVMPKLIQQVRRAEGLIACDSCKRFLYVPDDPTPGAGMAVVSESPST